MKWKSLLIPAILLVILSVIIVWLTGKSRDSTFSAKNTEFAVKDTGAIDEIHLSNMKGQEVKLQEVSPNKWMVNGNFPASQSKVETLLHTIRQVEVKKPVPMEARENVVKSLATENVQVDIYKDGNLVRSYYVGHQTPSELGTYMAMNNADKEPYVTHIPGFYGYLSTRYFADPNEWRSTLIWDFNPARIQEVTVSYPEGLKTPFKLQKGGREDFKVTHGNENRELADPSEKAVKRYLTKFRDFHCVEELDKPSMRDSLKSIMPDARLVVKHNQESRSLSLYGIFDERQDQNKGPDRPENYYALTPNRPGKVLLVQGRLVDPMLGEFQDFESSKIN